MFCEKCGQPIPDGASICPICGAQTAQQPNVTAPENQATYTAQPGAYNPYAAQQPYAQPQQGNYQQPPYTQPQQPYYQPGYTQPPVMPMQENPAPSFIDCIKLFFKNYVNFSGRSRRAEYWYVVLFNIIVSVVLGIISGIIATIIQDAEISNIISLSLSGVWELACLLPALALGVRRLHDIGKSGAMLLISLIPFVGSILLIVWCATDSDPAPNEYGVSPKYTPANVYGQTQQVPPVNM